MKFLKKSALLLVAATALFITSCHKDNNSSGYRYGYDDEFNADTHNWSFNLPSIGASVDVSGGYLNYNYYPASYGTNTVAIETGLDVTSDFSIQSSIKTNYQMGIAFGVSNSDYGYALFIDNSGSYALYDEGNSSITPVAIVDWTRGDVVSNAFNTVEIDQVGSSWAGYINGNQVFSVPARTFYGTKVGFIVNASTTGYADYLNVQWR